jgi:NADPH-dependent 2,4-dienoyl-CoA reductase/sulfur reductase-like enzyme
MGRIVVIGGSDAGTMAALRARELDRSIEITMVIGDRYPNFSVCGLPFFVSREVDDWRALAHRSADEISGRGIDLLLEHQAIEIDPGGRRISSRDGAGKEHTLHYDILVIATGARARGGGIEGVEVPGVHTLHTMTDSLQLRRAIDAGGIERAVIVGGGYIGLEMADALTRRGLRVSLVGRSSSVMPRLDPSLGQLVRDELERHHVEVVTSTEVREIARRSALLEVRGTGFSRVAGLVLVAGGVAPNSELARSAGVATGSEGAIRVDRCMRTNLPDVLAAGDCVETRHRLLPQPTYLPLGTTAHKQGRVAGETAVGGESEFAGSVGTQVVKVFDLAVACTGLRDDEARGAGFEPLTVESTAWHHKAYYPGARRLHVRVTGDRRTGRLLGAQIAGHWQAEVAKRIDIFATAVFHAMTVEGMNDLDLSYTPPMGSPWDAVQEAAQAWVASAR